MASAIKINAGRIIPSQVLKRLPQTSVVGLTVCGRKCD
jgi:hypothetical protein